MDKEVLIMSEYGENGNCNDCGFCGINNGTYIIN